MAWSHIESVKSAFSSSPVNKRTATFTSNVAVGDLIVACTAWDTTGGNDTIQDPTNGSLKDSLGNVYTLVKRQVDATSVQGSAMYKSIVTVSGKPTVTQEFSPTPGTTTAGSCIIFIDHWTGSDSNSAVSGTPNANLQNGPGTGTDILNPSSTTPTVDGCLIVSFYQNDNNSETITAGSNDTQAQADAGGYLVEYRTQTTAGAVTPTAGTSTNGGDRFNNLVGAFSPAAGGGGGGGGSGPGSVVASPGQNWPHGRSATLQSAGQLWPRK